MFAPVAALRYRSSAAMWLKPASPVEKLPPLENVTVEPLAAGSVDGVDRVANENVDPLVCVVGSSAERSNTRLPTIVSATLAPGTPATEVTVPVNCTSSSCAAAQAQARAATRKTAPAPQLDRFLQTMLRSKRWTYSIQ